MATTQNLYTGNGSTTNYSFTFEYISQADVKASLNGTATTAFTLANATTLAFNTAPASGVNIIIFRDTANETTSATFFAGSAIKAEDLNANFDQALYVSQETENNALSTLGGTMSGQLNMGNQKIVSLGTPTAATDSSTKGYVDGLITTHQAQVTAAAASAAAAATSETNAATSETNAATSASTSSTQATNSANSATASANSATASANSATASANSATASAGSASTATTQATNASNSAGTASTQATNSANSASAGATSASQAATSATNSATSATSSSTSATAAASSAASALAAFDNFDDTYLGAKASDPTTDNDGDPLTAGDLYFNTTSNVMKLYTGSGWVVAYVPGEAINISNTASGNLTSTNVQASLEELQTDIDSTVAATTTNASSITTNATNIATNVTNIAARLPLAGGTMTGAIVFNSGQTIAGYTPRSGATGSAKLPVGTALQRDTFPAGGTEADLKGYIRFNDDVDQFEGHNGTTWASVGGGATGGGSDTWAVEHDNTITQSYTIGTGKNVISAGPLTVNSGATVTVPSGSNWVIV